MRILADENIMCVEEAFAPLGELVVAPGRQISREMLDGVDVLLVRSVTRVSAELLEGTNVSFVASATAGIDHVDTSYLDDTGIRFAYAPGSNANSVAEYIVAALLHLSKDSGTALRERTLGVVGVGHVGKRVVKLAEALGITCVLNDPPLHDKDANPEYRPLDEIMKCDIVTLHTPLTFESTHATHQLIDEKFIAGMKRGAWLMNTARGGVVDETALKKSLNDGHIGACVLDVWEDEPNIDMELMDISAIVTSHIAGYSFDGKVRGTAQIRNALKHHYGETKSWTPLSSVAEGRASVHEVSDESDEVAVARIVESAYDIMGDTRRMRGLSDASPALRAEFFDGLRRDYPTRREFPATHVVVPSERSALTSTLTKLGFTLSTAQD